MKNQEALRLARELYEAKPHWTVFFREVLGVGGVVRKLFETPEELQAFAGSAEYQQIQRMMRDLKPEGDEPSGPLSVITVRMPSALHDVLRFEAEQAEMSMNRLCIGKLMQPLRVSDRVSGDGGSE